MHFDIIIGNPSYNNDVYIDFINISRDILSNKSNSLICMITPAKFVAKSSFKNKQFRKEIIQHISKIVNYFDCGDIFNIRLQGGVAYYIIDNNIHEEAEIYNHCSRVKAFNSENNQAEFRKLTVENCFINSNKLYTICSKVGCFESNFKHWIFGAEPIAGNFNVFASAINADAGGKISFHTFSTDGKLTMLSPMTITKETYLDSNDIKCFFTSSLEEESLNFISWINTKFIRFMVLMRYCTYHNNNYESWSFVPKPDNFNFPYTDEYFYKKYKLTEEEINIIESVIRERE